MSDSSTTLLIANVKRLLRMQGLTQGDLAVKSGISQPLVSRYMQEKTVPSLEKLDAIARGLGVHPWELLIEPDKRADMNFGFWECLMRVRDVVGRLQRGESVPEVDDLDALRILLGRTPETQETGTVKSVLKRTGE